MTNKQHQTGRLLTLLLMMVIIGVCIPGSVLLTGCEPDPGDDDQGTDIIDDDNNNNDNDDNDNNNDDTSDDDDDDTTGWPREIVDVLADGIATLGIAAPSGTDIVIVHNNYPAGELWMVRGRPGSWSTELIREDSVGIVSPAMTTDNYANVHVSFVDDVTQELIYGNNSAGTWEFETVDDGVCDAEGYCPETSLAVDGAGHVYVAYYIGAEVLAQDLMFGERTAEGWQVLLVPPSSGEDPQEPHVVVSQTARVVVQYIHNPLADPKVVKYVERVGDTWAKFSVYEFVDEATAQSAWPALDGQGVLHMLVAEEMYEPAWRQDLYYLSEASSWYPEYLFENVFDPRLVAGVNGEFHGCYLHWPWTVFEINYLHFREGEWTREVVDPNVVPTETAMIAVDPDGYAHIAYADGEDGRKLVYANNRPLTKRPHQK